MSICIIPARGGSKRIPRKNIKDFCGKPMIAWSIEAAKKSNIFSKIFFIIIYTTVELEVILSTLDLPFSVIEYV